MAEVMSDPERARARAELTVIFDFDGTLADTETPIYERARLAALALGAELTTELWGTHAVGRSEAEDWWPELAPALGLTLDRASFDRARDEVDIPFSRDTAELTAGARHLVEDLATSGARLAVASGSPRAWLVHHLGRFDLIGHFEALVGVDHPSVMSGKPRPDIYLAACAELRVDPATVVAVEDTTRGVAAARAAGIGAVVAVPNLLTVHHDLSAADLLVETLAALTPADLSALGRRPSRTDGSGAPHS